MDPCVRVQNGSAGKDGHICWIFEASKTRTVREKHGIHGWLTCELWVSASQFTGPARLSDRSPNAETLRPGIGGSDVPRSSSSCELSCRDDAAYGQSIRKLGVSPRSRSIAAGFDSIVGFGRFSYKRSVKKRQKMVANYQSARIFLLKP